MIANIFVNRTVPPVGGHSLITARPITNPRGASRNTELIFVAVANPAQIPNTRKEARLPRWCALIRAMMEMRLKVVRVISEVKYRDS